MTTATPTQEDARIERERAFHNERFAENPGRSQILADMTGSAVLRALHRTYQTVRPRCADAAVLDYGCSAGEASFILRRYGAAAVHGIDISDVAVAQATAAAREHNIDRCTFQVMNAENLEFEDGQFDVVFGIGILHHLDLDRASSEIARVLRPQGCAVFLEPLGHNPAINLMRWLTPKARTADEHPLKMADFEIIRRHFGNVRTQFVNLATLLAMPLAKVPGQPALARALTGFDDRLFRVVPWLGRYAWNAILELERPRRVIH